MKMRALKLAGIVLGALVALLIVLVLAVHLFVNPNDFKGRIAAAVKQSTGRELQLPGDIKLSVFPWIALELGPASLGNPPGFDAQPFVSVKRADLHVKLLPLLHKQLQVGKLAVEGLNLRLLKNAQGVGNWQGLGGKEQQPAPASAAGGGSEALKDLAGVTIKDSRISYQDMVVDDLNVTVGHVAAGVVTPVQLKTHLVSGKGAAPIDLDGHFDLAPDFAASRYEVSKLELTAARAAQGSSPALKLEVGLPQASADLQAQTLAAPAFTVVAGGAHISGALQGTKIVDAGQFSGNFKLEPCSPRDLMKALGIEPPKTRDPKALTRLSASGQFTYGRKAAQASGLLVQLDDTALKGSAGITDLDTQALGFDLALDHIDFDRYRAPAEPAAPKAAPAAAAGPESTPEGLKTLRMNGKLTAGQVAVAGVRLTQLAMTLEAKDGVTHIAPANAALYGGTFNGDITLDARGSLPLIKINQTLNGVDVSQLLHDLMGKPSRISGRGHVATNVTARGAAAPTIMRSLSGHVAADLDNGAVEGVDLWFEINRAVSLIQKQSLPGGSSSGRTKFDTFKATADLTNGVAATKDLSIISQNLRLSGQGTLDIVSEAVNYQIKATVLKQPTAGAVTAANTVAEIPANVTGTLTSPKVMPDLQGLAKARLQQELDKHKGDLQQQLQDKLKGLLK
jgi:AsmA protein